jgi:hypothetical protein
VRLSKTRKQNQVDDNYLIGGSRNAGDLSFFYRKKDIETIHVFLKEQNPRL